jgi:hypothetical protein
MTFSLCLCRFTDLIEALNLCTFHPVIAEQQTVTAPTQTGNVPKASNGKVLHRVISLTTANHGDKNHSGKTPPKPSPLFVPEKLHFSAYDKFEGKICSQAKSVKCRRHQYCFSVVNEALRITDKGEILQQVLNQFK